MRGCGAPPARPVPSGRIPAGAALPFALALAAAGLGYLFIGANALSFVLGACTLLTYNFVYTPLKTRTWWSTAAGAFPGAVPPLLGWAAMRGSLGVEAWVLYGILYLWQFPHVYAISWMYRDDYRRAGIRVLPVVEPSGESTGRQVVASAALLVPCRSRRRGSAWSPGGTSSRRSSPAPGTWRTAFASPPIAPRATRGDCSGPRWSTCPALSVPLHRETVSPAEAGTRASPGRDSGPAFGELLDRLRGEGGDEEVEDHLLVRRPEVERLGQREGQPRWRARRPTAVASTTGGRRRR